MRHRIAHRDRRPALQAPHAPRGVAAYRGPSGEGKSVVHPAVGHLRPLRRVTCQQLSACLAGTIANDPSLTRARGAQMLLVDGRFAPKPALRAISTWLLIMGSWVRVAPRS